jgi:hypothetical protein
MCTKNSTGTDSVGDTENKITKNSSKLIAYGGTGNLHVNGLLGAF